MNRTIAPVFSLLLATSILLIGNGLLGTLIPIRANIEHFATTTVGFIGSVYFAGFMAGCVLGPFLVRRAGHIRSFAALGALAAVAPLVHALMVNPVAWALMRGLTGFCFAGLYMVIESWINERATNATRGRLFAVYLVVNFASLTLGQLMLNMASPAEFTLFALCSILTSLALVPISMTTSDQPAPIASTRIDIGAVFRLSPVGLLGCLVVGLTNAPFWTLGPVFAHDSGLDVEGVSFFMTAAILGGAVAQLPIGRYSDKMDRRRIILTLSLGSAVAEAGLIAARGIGVEWMLLLAGFIFGCFALTLYSVCVAHTNDHAGKESFVGISSALLLAYAIGAVVGPYAASMGTERWGMSFIFMFAAAIHIIFAAFTMIRMATASRGASRRGGFTAMTFPSTKPVPPELDSRKAD